MKEMRGKDKGRQLGVMPDVRDVMDFGGKVAIEGSMLGTIKTWLWWRYIQ